MNDIRRWKYRTELVTAGENSQTVRGMTAGERSEFLELNKKVKDGDPEMTSLKLTAKIVRFGSIDPPLSEDDVDQMPPELFDAAFAKILVLSGLNSAEAEEKKNRPLTGHQTAVCRIAGFLGCSPSEVEDLPSADFDLLARYYHAEPWGPWRDNVHAAIIAREIRGWRSGGKRVNLDDFMVMPADARRRKNLSGFVDVLKSMAGGKRIPISEYRPPKRGKRGSGKTNSPARGTVRPTSNRARKG